MCMCVCDFYSYIIILRWSHTYSQLRIKCMYGLLGNQQKENLQNYRIQIQYMQWQWFSWVQMYKRDRKRSKRESPTMTYVCEWECECFIFVSLRIQSLSLLIFYDHIQPLKVYCRHKTNKENNFFVGYFIFIAYWPIEILWNWILFLGHIWHCLNRIFAKEDPL